MNDTHDIKAVLASLSRGGSMTEPESQWVFEQLLAGSLDEAQIGALLALIQTRSPTADELTGAARVMRARVSPTPIPKIDGSALIDTCGTGGAPKTFNVSTAAAIVAAAATPEPSSGVTRVLVAKHGNRSRTGRGSAEVLEALGVNVAAGAETQTACLEAAGVCFCFAIHHHPAMKYAAGPRRSLGFPTIFNLLGPLTNPAGAARQMIGVYKQEFVGLMAEALARLGAERAMIVHSEDGLDELSTTAPCLIATVEAGTVRTETVDAVDLGMARASIDDLLATSVEHAADIIRRVVDGEPGPMADMAVLSTAGALVVAGAASDLASGIDLARAAIKSGAARTTLDELVRVSNS